MWRRAVLGVSQVIRLAVTAVRAARAYPRLHHPSAVVVAVVGVVHSLVAAVLPRSAVTAVRVDSLRVLAGRGVVRFTVRPSARLPAAPLADRLTGWRG